MAAGVEVGVVRLAPAKVNLALHVTGRRADGYHLLDSVAVFTDMGDRVEIAPADRLTLAVGGQFAAHAPGDERDLSWRAASAFFEQTRLKAGASIRVEKNIPAGAGLGGGSSDAAAVLLALNALHGSRLSPEELRAIGLRIGADVPMCLAGHALRACGVGEEISPLDGWPALPMVLVWPGRPVSTADVFRTLVRRENPPLSYPPSGRSAVDIAIWLLSCRNDLEPPAIAIAPEIGDVLSALRATEGCLLARMSGSGSACFAVFQRKSEADAAADRLRKNEPRWWIAAAEAH